MVGIIRSEVIFIIVTKACVRTATKQYCFRSWNIFCESIVFWVFNKPFCIFLALWWKCYSRISYIFHNMAIILPCDYFMHVIPILLLRQAVVVLMDSWCQAVVQNLAANVAANLERLKPARSLSWYQICYVFRYLDPPKYPLKFVFHPITVIPLPIFGCIWRVQAWWCMVIDGDVWWLLIDWNYIYNYI